MNLSTYNKIMVIGNNGSGKSTCSKALAEITGLPLVHLDVEYWLPDLTRPTDDWWRQRNIELTAQEKWILDGNFAQGGAMELRWAAADLVIFLDVNRFACLLGVIKRNGKERPDGPRDYREKYDLQFFRFCAAILRSARSRKTEYLTLREKHPNTPSFEIKGRQEMRKLMKEWRGQRNVAPRCLHQSPEATASSTGGSLGD
jgi:adenylate kinase family enzyme